MVGRNSVLRFRHAATLIAILVVALAASCAKFGLGSYHSQSTPPNVLVILTDDQGWGDLSLHGNTNLSTPNLDSIALDGAQFEYFYVCPVCAPTRAEFLTGRYHPRGGVRGVSRGDERLDLDERTIAEAFHDAGYVTAAIGKWHNGSQYPYHPRGRGFDDFYGFTSGHWGHYFDPILEHNGEIVRAEGYINDVFTRRAIDYITANKDRPFFCYLTYNTPHSPYQVPDKDYEKQKNAPIAMQASDPAKEDPEVTRAALAMVENLDRNVGDLLKSIDDLGLRENTIVVYFNDNGPNSFRWNGGMKGKKDSTDEGGVRSPCFVRWPERIASGTKISEIAGAIDLFPTLCGLANTPPKATSPFDGENLAPLLIGVPHESNDRMIFSVRQQKVSARSQRWRLDDKGALFDMPADPGQTTDVSAQYPEVVTELKSAVEDWKRNVLSEADVSPRPFPVGYREFPITWLPARDGVPHGSIKRSANAPNSSFFTNWTTLEDRITWDVEVATSGTYEATIYYTCRAEDVGARVMMSFKDAFIEGVISEAHDPPLRGMVEDRVKRGGESYVKDFRPLVLGKVQLTQGRGELILQATEIPGKSVMDIRAVRLTLN